MGGYDEYVPGYRVHVEFDAEVNHVGEQNGDHWLYLKMGRDAMRHGIPLSELGRRYQVKIIGPEHWPPQPGDIWEIGGREFFAQDDKGIQLVSDDAKDTYYVPEASGDLLAQHPELVRRREQ